MSKITTDMVRAFNQRLGATGSPWSIVEGEYEGADYLQQVTVGTVNPTLAPFIVDDFIYSNGSDEEQTFILRVEKKNKLTRSLTITSSNKIGFATKLGFSIAGVTAEASLDLETTWGSNNTQTTEEEVTTQFEQPVRVPRRTLVKMQTIIQLQTVTNLPFELRLLLRDGRFGVVPKGTVPLYRYHDGNEHFYTRDPNTPPGFTKEGIACHVSNFQGPSMLPLYRYLFHNGNYHFYTTNPNEVGGSEEWLSEGNEGYVFPGAAPGTVPLYRYYNGSYHFYTADFNELGNGRDGWALEGIQAYVTPGSITDPALLRNVQELFPNTNDRLFIIPGQYQGQSTNRRIEVLLKSEPVTDLQSLGKESFERTPDHELARIPILSEKEALRVSPGNLVDLRQAA